MRNKYLLGTLGAGVMLASATVANAAGVAIYNAVPSPLPASLPSYGAEAYAFDEMGDVVQVDGDARALDSATVTMVSWACEGGAWEKGDCLTSVGATFEHPLTLSLYEVAESGAAGARIASVTQDFTMPYRPSASTECTAADAGKWFDATSGECYNGYAFNVTFDLRAAGVTVPQDFIYGIAYNTRTSGYSPIGAAGPYDSLNIGLNTDLSAPYVGTDVDPDVVILDGAPEADWAGYTIAIRFDTAPSGPTTADQCKNGGFTAFQFSNQGQCVASVNANERAGQ